MQPRATCRQTATNQPLQSKTVTGWPCIFRLYLLYRWPGRDQGLPDRLASRRDDQQAKPRFEGPWSNLMFSEIPSDARVVIVDDVAHNLKLLECSLKAFKLRNVVCFSDSAEALNWLQRESWDLLLLDLDMPQPDGFAILEALANRDRARAPVIILTALNDPENRRRGLELGANDYVTKPLDLPELLLRIRNCLHLAQATECLQHLNEHLEQEVRERTEQLNESYRAAIRGLSRAASYRDDETGEHILRIGRSAALLARTIGMSETWCETIRLAAPMHDLGKIGIPDHILRKPGPLTDEERRTMMKHPDIGYGILHEERGTLLIDMAAEIAYGHHEKWDGSGYPRGLAGEDIPWQHGSSPSATSTMPCAPHAPTSRPGTWSAPKPTSSSNPDGTSNRAWWKPCAPASTRSRPNASRSRSASDRRDCYALRKSPSSANGFFRSSARVLIAACSTAWRPPCARNPPCSSAPCSPASPPAPSPHRRSPCPTPTA